MNGVINVESLGASTSRVDRIDAGRQVDNADGLTLVRTIVYMTWGVDDGIGRGRLSQGLTLMNADTFAVGGSAAPEPEASPEEADWIWLAPELMHEGIGTGQGPRRGVYQADVRSKRQFGQGDVLVLVSKNIDATDAMDINGYVRCLLLLP